jgi:hypothetical protein
MRDNLDVNKWILENGEMQKAKKLEVLTFALGAVGELGKVPGVVSHDDDVVHIASKEFTAAKKAAEQKLVEGEALNEAEQALLAKPGHNYPADHIAVVRVVDGKILDDTGSYDIYAVPPEKLKLNNPIEPDLTEEQKTQLSSVLSASQSSVAVMTPAEDRTVIKITDEMIAENGGKPIMCRNAWDAEGVHTPMVAGDVFVVENANENKGYKIVADMFEGTHELQGPVIEMGNRTSMKGLLKIAGEQSRAEAATGGLAPVEPKLDGSQPKPT